jgi:hypothetical protein
VHTDYGQTGFEKSQTAFRCEERFALEVAKPAAVIAVAGHQHQAVTDDPTPR